MDYEIFDAEMPIPACFCAIHSAEDAVAAFISSAKEYGYDDARMTNIKDHVAKATVSLLAQKIPGILRIGRYQVAVALNPKTQALAARYIADGQTHCNEALTKLRTSAMNKRKYCQISTTNWPICLVTLLN